MIVIGVRAPNEIVGRIEATELAGDPTTMKVGFTGGDKMLSIRYELKG